MQLTIVRPLPDPGYPRDYHFRKEDYIAVSHLDVRGSFPISELIPFEQLAALAIVRKSLPNHVRSRKGRKQAA